MRRTVAAEMSSTIPSAMSWCASSVPSHWERLRPSRSGRSQASRTTWIATSGGKTPFGPAARGINEPIEAVGEKALGPLPHHPPLNSDPLCHLGWRIPLGRQENHAPPACQPCGHGGCPLPALQGLPLLRGEDNNQ